MKLTPLQLEILLTIMRRARSSIEIRDYIWQLHPQDAPDVSCIKVHVSNINKRIAGSGWRIICRCNGRVARGRGGRDGPGVYCLERDFSVAIPLAADPRDLWSGARAGQP